MRLDFFVNLRYQTGRPTIGLGIKYSMRDLISDVNYCYCGVFVQAPLVYHCALLNYEFQKLFDRYLFSVSGF